MALTNSKRIAALEVESQISAQQINLLTQAIELLLDALDKHEKEGHSDCH